MQNENQLPVINTPPSKSVAHRALICGALSGGKCSIKNTGTSLDIRATLNCIKALGIDFIEKENEIIFTGIKKEPVNGTLLDCGESGSTLRFFIPIAAALSKDICFTGRGRLMQRPLSPFEECFKQNGVELSLKDEILRVSGELKSGKYYLQGNVSSQFITGLLFALPMLEGDSEIILTTSLESKAYVDLTLNVLTSFGIIVENLDYQCFKIKGNQKYSAANFTTEADFSGGAFFLVLSAIGTPCIVNGLNLESAQGDKEILAILNKAGAEIITTQNGILIKANELKAFDVDVSEIPDLVPPLAALMCFCKGESHILNAARLRIKESDRLAAVAKELNALGANVAENEHSLTIKGVCTLHGAEVSAHNDHRIAMMLALCSTRASKKTIIDNPQCVEKSYPEFWQHFNMAVNGDNAI